jgi:hypothetical protein
MSKTGYKKKKKRVTDPLSEVDQTAAGGLQQDGGSVGGAMETQLSKGHVKLHLVLGDALHFLTETLEGRLQLLSQLFLSLQPNIQLTLLQVLLLINSTS